MDVKKEQPLILCVDDNIDNLQVLTNLLNAKGYKPIAVKSGEEALKYLQKKIPDLILLDIMMPKMDGYQTCNIIKQDPKLSKLPIIFLTAKTELEDIVKGFDLGAVDYVTKPFQSSELLARVKTHIELKRSREMIETLSEERKVLIHILCHDLTNPIGGSLSLLDFFEPGVADFDELKKMMTSMLNNGLDIVNLVRQMMQLDEIEQAYHLEQIQVKEAVLESKSVLEHKLKAKNIELVLNIPDEYYIIAEKISFINTVLSNILSNAIKFSNPNSQIIVTTVQEKDFIVLTIQDFGIGIPEVMIDDIFDVKKMTHRKGTKGEPGTGFGMPLVKKFVNLYQGNIKLISNANHDEKSDSGTKVEIKLKVNK